MWKKWKQHALQMNFRKRFLIVVAVSLIAMIGFSAASYMIFSREEASWESSVQSEHSSRSESRPGGRSDTDDRFENDREDFEEPALSTADKALMISGGIVGTVLGVWYWVLCMIWAYRKSHRMGINSAVWVWATLFFNLPAIAALYLYGIIRGTCSRCGKIRAKGDRYCSRCGLSFTKECPACGQDVDIRAAYCPNCGEKLDESPDSAKE